MKSKVLTLILFASTAALAQSNAPSASDKRLESDSVQGGIVRDVDGTMMDDNTTGNAQSGVIPPDVPSVTPPDLPAQTQEELSAPSAGVDDSRDDTKQGVSDIGTPQISPPIRDQNNNTDQYQNNYNRNDLTTPDYD